MSNEMMRIGNENKTLVLSSREVAEMIEKDHAKLMRDIRTYIGYLAETNLGLGDFFTESSYVDNNSQTRPCYNITKKGCEFIAHKMTGQKGAIFTATYIDRFHLMEESLKQVIPMLTEEQKLQLAIFNASSKEESIIASAELDRYRQSQIKEKEQELLLAQPKVDAWDRFLDSKGTMDFQEFVKTVGLKMGRNTFMARLRDEKILMSDKSRKNTPYQTFMDREYFRVIQTVFNGIAKPKTLVTKKGCEWLHKKCKEWNLEMTDLTESEGLM